MTDEEKAAADAKAKKQDGFLDKLADRIIAKQGKAAAAEKPPSRDVKPDPILDDASPTGDQDLDEFIFGEKPADPNAKPPADTVKP